MELLAELSFSPEWIAFLRSRNLLSRDVRVGWSLGQWATSRLSDPAAFREMLESIAALGSATADVIERGLASKDRPPLAPYLEKAWRLLTAVIRRPPPPDRWHARDAFGRLKQKSATGHDMEAATQVFAPRLRLRMPYTSEGIGKETLSSVCRVELECDRYVSLDDLLKSIPVDSTDIWSLTQLASGTLIHSLIIARDAELVGSTRDRASLDVPSVNEHEQNALHYGFLPITRLNAELWLRLLAAEPAKASAIAQFWRQAGFALTSRLWLFTLQNNKTLEPDAIIEALLDLPPENFWAHRKEVMELLRDRICNASQAALEKLVERITAGPALGEGTEPATKQRVLDSYIWVYLAALKAGEGSLTSAAQACLDQINERTGWSNRTLDESDFFWMWSYGTRVGPIGDPAPIAEAPTEKRIDIAADLEKRDAINQGDAWRVYSRQDPEGAFEAVVTANDVAAHSGRWRDVLWAIPEIGDATDQAKSRGQQLCSEVFGFFASNKCKGWPNSGIHWSISTAMRSRSERRSTIRFGISCGRLRLNRTPSTRARVVSKTPDTSLFLRPSTRPVASLPG
jgi:hypothetical protein